MATSLRKGACEMAQKQRLTDAVEAGLASASQLAADAEVARLRSEVASLRGRYKSALAAIDAERSRADSILQLQGIKPAKRMSPKAGKAAKHSATMVRAARSHGRVPGPRRPCSACGKRPLETKVQAALDKTKPS